MRRTNKSQDGTAFYGTELHCSVSLLRAVLGQPDMEGNDGQDKINFEWVMETEAGDVFTVYDYKEYRVLEEDEQIEWHIGGISREVTDQAAMEIWEAVDSHKRRPGNQ